MRVGYEGFIVLWNTALQLHVPGAVLSRVAAVEGVGSFALLPLAFAVVAPVAELVSPSAVLVAAGLSVVAGAAALLAARSVRELRGPRTEVDAARGPAASGVRPWVWTATPAGVVGTGGLRASNLDHQTWRA